MATRPARRNDFTILFGDYRGAWVDWFLFTVALHWATSVTR